MPMISDYPTVTTPDVADELLLSQSGNYVAMPLLKLQGHILKFGSSTFGGNGTACTISLPRTVSSANNYAIFITPTASDGMIGEIYVSKDTTSVSIYNTGTSTGAFDYMILYHNG